MPFLIRAALLSRFGRAWNAPPSEVPSERVVLHHHTSSAMHILHLILGHGLASCLGYHVSRNPHIVKMQDFSSGYSPGQCRFPASRGTHDRSPGSSKNETSALTSQPSLAKLTHGFASAFHSWRSKASNKFIPADWITSFHLPVFRGNRH